MTGAVGGRDPESQREIEREKVLFFQSDELKVKKADQAFTMRTLPDSYRCVYVLYSTPDVWRGMHHTACATILSLLR